MANLPYPTAAQALPGRTAAIPVENTHIVLNTTMQKPFPAGHEILYVALGCFWGAERKFWQLDGVYSTAVGYIGGFTPNPTYHEVCSGMTGHTEAVMVVYDPQKITIEKLLQVFWQSHDPTQGMRQGNDEGTQYRSGLYATTAGQLEAILHSKAIYQQQLNAAGYGEITTEITTEPSQTPPFYFAEDYHQQYLAKNPDGYCGLGGTGVRYCP